MARCHFVCLWVWVLLPFCGRAQPARKSEGPSAGERRPLLVALMAPLDGPRISSGAPVFAKALQQWSSGGCRLATGALVSGRVTEVLPLNGGRGASMALRFEHADCGGHTTAFPFLLYAVLRKPEAASPWPVDRAGLFGSTSARSTMTPGGSRTAGPAPENTSQDMNLGRGGSSSMPTEIRMGQVVGLKDLTLTVNAGPGASSVLAAGKHKLRLENGTELVLVPLPAPTTPREQDTGAGKEQNRDAVSAKPGRPAETAANVTDTRALPPPETDQSDVCSSNCSTAPTDAAKTARSVAALNLRSYGYAPHEQRRFEGFNYDSTVSYLGAGRLLVTFDLHRLRHRFSRGEAVGSTRAVRALLLDAHTLAVLRVLDWQVGGDGQYLWDVSGKVLVLIGETLRLLNRDLVAEGSYRTGAPVTYVAVAPGGERFAVGTLHERYSREDRRRLETTLGAPPEESVDVVLLDAGLRPMFWVEKSSFLPPPVLTDKGEVVASVAGRDHWILETRQAEGAMQRVARVVSSCPPRVSAPMPGHLFVVGCSSAPYRNWYRMLRVDGRAVLRSSGSSREIEQASQGSEAGSFAVRIVRARNTTAPGDRFYKADLQEQEIGLYAARDGRQLLVVRTPEVSPVEQSFAVSPDGAAISALVEGSVAVFAPK